MINSIQQFQEKGVKNLTEVFSRYTADLTKFAEMILGVTQEVTKLGLSMIEEELESYVAGIIDTYNKENGESFGEISQCFCVFGGIAEWIKSSPARQREERCHWWHFLCVSRCFCALWGS